MTWAIAGKSAAVIGYALFFVWMTRKAIHREIELEAEDETLFL